MALRDKYKIALTRITELERQLSDLRQVCDSQKDKLDSLDKWIGVDEWPPEDENPVIVHIPAWESHRVDVGFYRRNVSTRSEYWLVRSVKAPVAHWRPLPDSPSHPASKEGK